MANTVMAADIIGIREQILGKELRMVGDGDLRGDLERLAEGARQAFEARYTEDANYRMLMAIYQQAITVSHERKGER